ncbi:MAG: hypothetical protein LBF22_12715 [Deltaproteobacteria bacterium]|nr:hypothetical protein [Deltaproteobacteria bacterium]
MEDFIPLEELFAIAIVQIAKKGCRYGTIEEISKEAFEKISTQKVEISGSMETRKMVRKLNWKTGRWGTYFNVGTLLMLVQSRYLAA